MELSQIRLRTVVSEDIGFIFNSWLKNQRTAQPYKLIDASIFYAEHHKIVERLIQNSTIVIACDNNDSSHIYGYICATFVDGIFCMHFLYVKEMFRRLGIGRLLFNAFPHTDSAGIHTHTTSQMMFLQTKFNLVYHPHILCNYDLEKKEPSDG